MSGSQRAAIRYPLYVKSSLFLGIQINTIISDLFINPCHYILLDFFWSSHAKPASVLCIKTFQKTPPRVFSKVVCQALSSGTKLTLKCTTTPLTEGIGGQKLKELKELFTEIGNNSDNAHRSYKNNIVRLFFFYLKGKYELLLNNV